MTLHHLEIFVAVCREKTTHAAAEKLNLSQPAVSKAITDIEKYYEISLFERMNRRLYLTPIGETMRDYAYQVLEAYERMETEINRSGARRHIRIGASVSVGTRLLPPLLQKLARREETVTYEVMVDNTSKIEQMIENYNLDIGLVEGYVDNQNLVMKNIAEDALVIAVRADHPLLLQKEPKIQELEKYPFITREGGSSARNQLELHLQELGVTLTSNYSCSNIEAIKQALLYTDGVSVLSSMMIEQEVREGSLAILPWHDLEFKRTIRLIYHKNKRISPAMEAFLALLKDQV